MQRKMKKKDFTSSSGIMRERVEREGGKENGKTERLCGGWRDYKRRIRIERGERRREGIFKRVWDMQGIFVGREKNELKPTILERI